MKKIKVSEATGQVLDALVALAHGYTNLRRNVHRFDSSWIMNPPPRSGYGQVRLKDLDYSTDWSIGGLIIQTERIDILNRLHKPWLCEAEVLVAPATRVKGRGPTPLIAAMRCYVISKLGEEVEVPDALT